MKYFTKRSTLCVDAKICKSDLTRKILTCTVYTKFVILVYATYHYYRHLNLKKGKIHIFSISRNMKYISSFWNPMPRFVLNYLWKMIILSFYQPGKKMLPFRYFYTPYFLKITGDILQHKYYFCWFFFTDPNTILWSLNLSVKERSIIERRGQKYYASIDVMSILCCSHIFDLLQFYAKQGNEGYCRIDVHQAFPLQQKLL